MANCFATLLAYSTLHGEVQTLQVVADSLSIHIYSFQYIYDLFQYFNFQTYNTHKIHVKTCRKCFFDLYKISLYPVESHRRKIVHNTGISC